MEVAMKHIIPVWILFFTLFVLRSSQAQDLMFNFINPNFIGGNTFNASWLMAEAQAQNSFTAPVTTTTQYSAYSQDPLKTFSDNLNRQILSQISSKLTRGLFGENGLEAGHYDIGDYSIDISQGLDGITINIIDNVKGGETNILVPYF